MHYYADQWYCLYSAKKVSQLQDGAKNKATAATAAATTTTTMATLVQTHSSR